MVHKQNDYSLMDTFSNAERSKKNVKDEGKQIILKLYGDTSSKYLNEYRFFAYKGEVLWVLPFSLQAFLPQVLQHSNIYTELITRYSNGWETFYHPQTGGGRFKMAWYQLKLIFRLIAPESLLNNCFTSMQGCRMCNNVMRVCEEARPIIFCTSVCMKCSGETCSNAQFPTFDIDYEKSAPTLLNVGDGDFEDEPVDEDD